MRSMTGFGMGECPFGAGKLSVEVRGVNHRFLDVRVRVPRELAELAPYVEQLARERLTRGRFEIDRLIPVHLSGDRWKNALPVRILHL